MRDGVNRVGARYGDTGMAGHCSDIHIFTAIKPIKGGGTLIL